MDLCASRHLTNNSELFIRDLKVKSLDFTTASRQTFRAKSVGTVIIPLTNKTIRLKSVAYAPDCNANLIFLEKLCKSNIMFVDDKDSMTQM